MKCKSCGFKIQPFFSLGKMPLVNSFSFEPHGHSKNKYDLTLAFCPKCFLVQLTKIIDPKILFTHYIYMSGVSSQFVQHCKETADYVTRRFKLTNKNLVLELASNDGTQLLFFKKKHIQILGIDPARNIALIANKAGIPTIPEFFSLSFAKKLKKERSIRADIIFGANVLAHVPNVLDFVKGVKELLSPRGSAIFESPYITGLFENKFDTIYHEHVFYYSALSLDNLFRSAGLEIYDMEMTEMQGGSFRLFAAHPGVYKKTKRLISLFNKEKKLGYTKLNTYQKIKDNVENLRFSVTSVLEKLKKRGKHIAAYAAPAKGVILLNYFNIEKYLDFVVDKSKEKQGLYIPGTGLKIGKPEQIFLDKPDYILILCWNIAREIYQQLDTYRGSFILPIPKVVIRKNK